MWSEPIELLPKEVKRWNEFLEWIKAKKLEPLKKEYLGYDRLGTKLLLGYNGNFKNAYKVIQQRDEYFFPKEFKEKYNKLLAVGALYV
jgi:hypothetical protein